MKLDRLKTESIKPLYGVIAFKWIKPEMKTKSGIIIPDAVLEQNKERMGHKYTCEVIAAGPDCHIFKPGNRFVLHEYNKIDQGSPWKEDEVMFCYEKHIAIKVPINYDKTQLAGNITEEMEAEYSSDDQTYDDSPIVAQSREDLQGPEWARANRH